MGANIPREEVERVRNETDIVAVVGRYVKLSKAGVDFKGLCPFHNEKTPSFTVSPSKRFYHCHGCGAHGDVIDFMMAHAGMPFRDAVSALGGRVDDGASRVNLPVPKESPPPAADYIGRAQPDEDSRYQRLEVAGEDMPTPPKAHFSLGVPTAVYPYTRADGAVHGYIYRFAVTRDDGSISKVTWPLTPWLDTETGKPSWRWKAMAEPRPLYGLDTLAAAQESMPADVLRVLLVEGEKCKDAAEMAMLKHGVSGWVVASWSGGSKAALRPGRNDWAPLAGLTVVQWPDCDSKRRQLTADERAAGVAQESTPLLPEREQPGVMAMDAIGEELIGLGCTVLRVRIAPPGSIEDGWDIADAISELEPSEWIGMLESAQPWEPGDPAPSPDLADEGEPLDLTLPETEAVSGDLHGSGSWTLERVNAEFALIQGTTRVWHAKSAQAMSMSAFKQVVGLDAAKDWGKQGIGDGGKRSVSQQDVARAVAENKARQLVDDMRMTEVMERYVVLGGTTSIFDGVRREVYTAEAVKLEMGPEVFKDWVNSPHRKTIPANWLVFDPTESLPDGYINTYHPVWPKYVKPAALMERRLAYETVGFFPECDKIIRLSMQLCNYDIEVWTWLMCWLAYPLQHPGAKLDTSVIMASPENGTGKSLLFDWVMRTIYGQYSVMIGSRELVSSYNQWMEDRLFVLCEEATDPKDPLGTAAKLKSFITSQEHMVEAKFLNGKMVKNMMQMVILSNLITMVTLDPSDRRYLCVSPRHILSEAEQTDIEREIKNGGIEAFYSFLMSIKLAYQRTVIVNGKETVQETLFNTHTKPPMTEAKRRMIDLSKTGWESFFDEWSAGQILFANETGEQTAVPCGPVLKDELYAFYCAWAGDERVRSTVAKSRLFHMAHGKGAVRDKQLIRIPGQRDIQRTVFYPKATGEAPPPEHGSKQDWLGASVVAFRQAVKSAYGVDVTERQLKE